MAQTRKTQVDVLDMGQGPLVSASDMTSQNRRAKLAMGLARGMSLTDAASWAGIDKVRANQLLNDDDSFWIDVSFSLKRQAATRYAPGALATLVHIHTGEEMPAYARIAAARTVLEMADLVGQGAVKWRDHMPMGQRAPGPNAEAIRDPAKLAGDVKQLRGQISMLRQALNGHEPREAIEGEAGGLDPDAGDLDDLIGLD